MRRPGSRSPAGLPHAVGRAAWSELWELTQARGHALRDAETTLRVHRDLLEVLTQVQV